MVLCLCIDCRGTLPHPPKPLPTLGVSRSISFRLVPIVLALMRFDTIASCGLERVKMLHVSPQVVPTPLAMAEEAIEAAEKSAGPKLAQVKV